MATPEIRPDIHGDENPIRGQPSNRVEDHFPEYTGESCLCNLSFLWWKLAGQDRRYLDFLAFLLAQIIFILAESLALAAALIFRLPFLAGFTDGFDLFSFAHLALAQH